MFWLLLVSLSATVIFLYAWLIPTCIWGFLTWRGNRSGFTYLEIVCVYGYSLAVFVPISVSGVFVLHFYFHDGFNEFVSILSRVHSNVFCNYTTNIFFMFYGIMGKQSYTVQFSLFPDNSTIRVLKLFFYMTILYFQILWLLPFDWLRWVLVLVGAITSGKKTFHNNSAVFVVIRMVSNQQFLCVMSNALQCLLNDF